MTAMKGRHELGAQIGVLAHLVRHEKRQRRALDHLPSDPAEQRLAETRVAVASHHDDVGSNVCRLGQQGLRYAVATTWYFGQFDIVAVP